MCGVHEIAIMGSPKDYFNSKVVEPLKSGDSMRVKLNLGLPRQNKFNPTQTKTKTSNKVYGTIVFA